ncbi:hypothetical protein, partial [Paenibacillus solani]|uniref:hypothetical protein n=1 Tax=Paenibacillus solani TaxID=1705565 RepID=UPI003D2B49E9
LLGLPAASGWPLATVSANYLSLEVFRTKQTIVLRFLFTNAYFLTHSLRETMELENIQDIYNKLSIIQAGKHEIKNDI